MNSLTVCAAATVASLLAVFLKKNNAEYSIILSVAGSVIILLYVIVGVAEVITEVKSVFSTSHISTYYVTVLLKCVGICFLTEFSSDTCKDAGQTALSNIVLLSGRVSILISALPLFSELLGIVKELLGG